jgi:polar amino acid transport system substrate-binding protein
MKTFRFKTLLLLSLLSFCTLATINSQACQLRSVWEPYPPYQYLNEKDQLRGLDIELLEAVAKAANCHVTFQALPWKRGLALLSKGLIDVGSGASKTKERSEYAHFSDPYRIEAMSVYVQREPFRPIQFNNLNQLASSSAHVGIVIGYSYGDEFNKLRAANAFKGKVSEVLSDSLNIHKLLASRIDVILIEQFGGTQLIEQIPKNHKLIKRHPLKVKTGDIYFLFSKVTISKAKLKQFNQALEHIKESGQYQSIVDKYIAPAN